ncbi:protein kinase [Actinoplanes sp. Pm04-4]|uniref:non-specific serine/threonine protein kinase n=1 Tax=Paractinoplanes pyxinae TaxID=2997416 RepID=A0ABT4B5J2_9ACTN|nr:serine/threonine-protein kinase [Actinoplanes pyxinae]MCY1141145.1 protein kinase [Actinoplanes pyxinae]
MPLIAGRYRLGETLGVGGMGKVWQARDEVLQRDVAIKEVLIPDDLQAKDKEAVQRRTLREARAAARLSHPNVVQVFDVFDVDGRVWIVMAYVPSQSLHEVLKTSGPLDPRRVARIGLDLLAALRAAHSAGVDHRDVKPANVLLTDDGRVLLTDFGIATIEGDAQISSSDMLIGSPEYMSPERAKYGTAGMASDLWSLGATLYAAVEGHSPFRRRSALATLTALAADEPDPPHQAGLLEPVLRGLLRKDPAQRISASEAEHLLREATSGAYGHALVPVRTESPTTEDLPALPPPTPAPSPAAPPAAPADSPAPADNAAPPIAPADAAPGSAPAGSPSAADDASPGSAPVSSPAADGAVPGRAPGGSALEADDSVSPAEGPSVPSVPTQRSAPPADVSSPPAAAAPPPTAADAAGQPVTAEAVGPSEGREPAAADAANPSLTAEAVGSSTARGSTAATPPARADITSQPEASTAAASASAVPRQRPPSSVESIPADVKHRGQATPVPPDAEARPTVSPMRRWLVAAAAVLAVIAGVVFWTVSRSNSGDDPKTDAGGPAVSAPAPATPSSTPGTSATAADPSAAATSKATPSPTGNNDGDGGDGDDSGAGSGSGLPQLPDGWRDYRDRTGFAVYVPEGWARSKEGSIVYFRDSSTGRVLGIDQTKKPVANPVADWRGKADYRVSRGDFPAYREIHIREVDYFRKAADWEFTFTRNGTRQHVNNRGVITSDTQAYGFYWQTPDSSWARYRDDLQLVFDSFRPAD